MGARFVGRREEMLRLGELLEAARSGNGRLVTISGDAGIGKTRLMGEIARLAGTHGCRVLWSQMIEDPVAPPYLAWLLALRGHLQQADDASLREDLGSGAGDVADILPELRDRLGTAPSRPPRDADAARFQLFDAVARFLLALARRQPLVLLFDNLHLADRSSLRLLEYYAHQLTGSATLVVVAYRHDDALGDSPLRQTLARLSRTVDLEAIELAGLSREEIAELLRGTVSAPPALVDAIHTRGDGNPLFACQVAAALARRGGTVDESSADGPFEFPDSLGDVIAGRLAAVGPAVLEILRVGAVIGRDFGLPMVARLCDRAVVELADRAEQAVAAAIVTPLGFARYRFQHALFREFLYQQIPATERYRLHEAAARHLESRPVEGTPVAQLAYHWYEASQAGYRPQAVEWCRRAAAEAVERRAYGEAAVELERALQLLDLSDSPDPGLRFDLLSALGEAQYLAGQPALSDQAWLKAALLANHHRFSSRLASAVLAWQYVRAWTGVSHLASVPLHNAALELLPPDDDATRARLLASLALAFRHRNETDRARATLAESVELARQVARPDVLYACLIKGFYILYRAHDAPVQLAMMEEALEIARHCGSEEDVLLAMGATLFPLIKLGRIEELRAQNLEFTERADAARHHFFRQLASGVRAMIAILEGRWADALATAQASLRQATLEGHEGVEGRYAFQMFAIQRALGGLAAVAPLLERFAHDQSASSWLPGRILLHTELGQPGEARRALQQLGDLRELVEDDLYESSLAYLAEACARIGDGPRCRVLYELLEPYRGFTLSLLGVVFHGPASGYLALLAAAMRRHAKARRLFEESLDLDEALGSVPLLARSRTDYAEFLLRSERPADTERAERLLAEARAGAKRLGMRALLARIDALTGGRSAPGNLTARELAVLRLVAAGASNKLVARTLNVSTATVATHLRNILRKTGSRNRTQAVAYARRHALLPAD